MGVVDSSRANGVLVVEDEALVRMLVVQTLEEAGFIVREAAEAQGALEVLRTDRAIRLMVTDVGLPGLNGRRLAEAARAERPDMKVLFMTGYADSSLLENILPEGFGLITKPFDLDDLAARAQALMVA
ncbi:MAG TPA: response regulator [Caulobacteraceae bacterium]